MTDDADFNVGDRPRINLTFKAKDNAGAWQPADPTEVVVKARKPDGTIVTIEETNDPAVGAFHVDISLDQAGKWRVWAKGTGAVETAGEIDFDVRHSVFA